MSSSVSPFSAEANGSKSGSPGKSSREKPLIAVIVILAILLIGVVIAVIILAIKSSKPPSSDVCTSPGCLETALDMMHSMNDSVDPCDNFFNFACGRWPIFNSEQGDTTLSIATIKSFFKLHENMIHAAADESLPDNIKKIIISYVKCGLYDDLKDEDERWLIESLDEVGGWPMIDSSWNESHYHWERNLAHAFHNFIIKAPLHISVGVNIYDTSTFIIQVGQPEFEEMQPFDKEQILSIAKKLGAKDENLLEKEYEKVVEFRQNLEKMSRRADELEEDSTQTKIMSIKELQNTIPWVNWPEFLRTVFGSYLKIPIHDSEPVLVGGVNYISQVLQPLFKGTVSKRNLANYIAISFIQTLRDANSMLGESHHLISSPKAPKDLIPPDGFSNGCFNFYTTKASPVTDFINYRSRKAGMMDKNTLSYFVSSMNDLISEASWLDDTTKKRALEKLHATNFFIGFPDAIRDPKQVDRFYDGLPNFTSNVLQNQLAIARHSFKKSVELLRTVPDRNKWPIMEELQGTQVNAFHVPFMNAVVLPADIQTKPIFSSDRPKFWNFGVFGWVIGHEITHGLDTSGSKRDKYGNLRNWWMPKAKEQFNNRAKCLIKQYNKIPYGYEDHYVNGTQTIAENVADNGGLRQAYFAYKKWEKDHGKEKSLPGLEKYNTDQLFFISVAQAYCSAYKEPKMVYEFHVADSHTPTQMRVNPATANFDAFGKAFNCKTGSPMNPANKCTVW